MNWDGELMGETEGIARGGVAEMRLLVSLGKMASAPKKLCRRHSAEDTDIDCDSQGVLS